MPRGNLLKHPKVRALATANPKNIMTQSDALNLGQTMFAEHFQNFERFAEAYTNAGIEKRHICVPLEWLYEDHQWKERSDLYLEAATNLAEEAVLTCIAKSALSLNQIDGIVAVSSTGFATPSLDAHLCERLALRTDIKRLPIFGLGCAGGVTGLARAAELAKAAPGSNWLLVIVELCSLTFRAHDKKKANIIATALFGDGAAAAILVPITLAVGAAADFNLAFIAIITAISTAFAFMTSFGTPPNLIVQASGIPTSNDFLRNGVPLVIIAILFLVLAQTYYWEMASDVAGI